MLYQIHESSLYQNARIRPALHCQLSVKLWFQSLICAHLLQVWEGFWSQTFQWCVLSGLSLYLYVLLSDAFAQRGLKSEQNKDWQSLRSLNSNKWNDLTEVVKKAFASSSTSTNMAVVRVEEEDMTELS